MASSVVDGLAWWQTWIAVWIGYCFVTIFVILASRPGAVYHIGFPVLSRASFGIFGSIWPILNRVATATLWTAYQSYLGGQCITLVLRSIWPSYNNLPNSIPESAGVTTRDFLSFFLFWLCMLPAAYTRVEKIKYLFIVKSIVVPAAFFAMFGWSIHDANGLGPIVHQPSRLQGSALGWAFVTAVTNQISNMVTLVCNMADFARVARKRSDTVLSQALAIPLTFAITSFVGLIIASSSTVIFGTTVFNILDILSMRLDRDPQASGVRAGTFFIAASFTLGQIGTNVAANTLSAGSDLTALFPRYLTIRRGSMLSLAIALCICPWKFANSNSNFAAYLSAYSVLLSPFVGIILGDYFIVRRGLLNVPELYTLNRSASYWYKAGLNPRAYIAYLAGILINIVGFAGAVGADVSEAAIHVYRLAPFTGSLVALVFYLAGCYLFPPPGYVDLREKAWLEPVGGYEAEDWSRPTQGRVADVEDAGEAQSMSEKGSQDKPNVHTVEY